MAVTSTVLDSIALGYQPVWGPSRQLMAVRMHVLTLQREAVSAEHLIRALGNDWPAAAPTLIIVPRSLALLDQALRLPPVPRTMLEVPASLFSTPEGMARMAMAARGGHRLVRRIDLAEVGDQAVAPVEACNLVCLAPEDLQAARQAMSVWADDHARAAGPLVPNQMYEGVDSRQLADHALDDIGVAGLVGWPVDDTLQAYQRRPFACDRSVIDQIRVQIEKDGALDRIEYLIQQDPVMIHRLLAHVNEGGRREVDSLRLAIMMLGFTALERWLSGQHEMAETDPALRPVRYGMVMRARLAQHLLDSGAEDNLRAEVYLTAIFAELHRLLERPLADLLDELPLSARVRDALLRQSGPYHTYLDLATAQGRVDQLHHLPQVCETRDISLETANRALVRMLATTRDTLS